MPIKVTTEEFIKRAKEVHGDKYGYSKVEYTGRKKKVCIICPIHGEFWQRADSHLTGMGCPKCSKKYKYTSDEFIKESKKVHGNKYDYSKAQYEGGRKKLCIICPEHGEFWKLPYEHLNGKGCPKCVNKKLTNAKSTTEEFIKRAKKVHGNKYDYSKVDYLKAHSKVCIICPEHGKFWQTPNSHLKGSGCPKCGKTIKLSLQEFIERAKKVHNNKYDYSKVNYENAHTKVCIICPEHGEFWQLPYVHLQGHGCPKCKIQMFSNKYRLTLEEFIKKANKCHNNFYDYSKVNYKNAKEKVCIICPEHGEFWQLPNNHLFGNGCPECKKSKLEKKMKNFLIENKIRFSEQKTFEWLIYKENMRLDFYLPDYNIAIECQGEQHFKPVNFGCETEEDMFEQFKNTQDRDKKKKELCNTNNIKLLYYSDKKYENNIFTDLKEILKYIELCLRE
jgi:hypothetical protein